MTASSTLLFHSPKRVTELARLTVNPHISDDVLLPKLARVKRDQQAFNGQNVYIMRGVENESHLYVIGEWESVKQHMEEWVPSNTNQALLALLDGMVTVDWVFHLDVSHAELPFPTQVPLENVWSIGHHYVSKTRRAGFEQAFAERKHCVDAWATQGKPGGGWRIDLEDDVEEFVLFCPWKNVQQHTDFATFELFQKYAEIRDYIQSFEVSHARMIDLEQWSS